MSASPWQSPVGDPEKIDVITNRLYKSGVRGVDLFLVVAGPLDLDDRTVEVVAQKFRGYCQYVKSPAFAGEFGPPVEARVRIAIRSDWEIPEEIIEMIGGIADEEQVPAELGIFYEDPPEATDEEPVLDATKMYPYVVPRSYFDLPEGLPAEVAAQMGQSWMPQQEGFVLPLRNDIVTTLVVSTDDGQMLRCLQPEDLERAGLDPAKAHSLALANLERLARDGTTFQTATRALGNNGRPVIVWHGHWLAASCIVLPWLYDWAKKAVQNEEFGISIPQGEVMVLFPWGEAGFIEDIKSWIKNLVAGMDKLITFELFRLTPAGISPLVETES